MKEALAKIEGELDLRNWLKDTLRHRAVGWGLGFPDSKIIQLGGGFHSRDVCGLSRGASQPTQVSS